MTIKIIFDKPQNGWWDGGAKSDAEFEVDRCHALSPEHTCFGSWGVNVFFNVKTGKTEKETLSRAKRYLKRHCKVPFTFAK